MEQIQSTLIAKICHDIATPLGALGMGIELLEDHPIAGADSSVFRDLYASFSILRQRLELYRKIFATKGSVLLEDCHAELKSHLLAKKINFVIDKEPRDSQINRLMVFLILQVSECLPYGGKVILQDYLLTLEGFSSEESLFQKLDTKHFSSEYKGVFILLFQHFALEWGYILAPHNDHTVAIVEKT